MKIRAAVMAATAAFALAGLGAGPAFADNHISVAPQSQDGSFEHLSPQHMTDGAYEHLAPRTPVVGDLATN